MNPKRILELIEEIAELSFNEGCSYTRRDYKNADLYAIQKDEFIKEIENMIQAQTTMYKPS